MIKNVGSQFFFAFLNKKLFLVVSLLRPKTTFTSFFGKIIKSLQKFLQHYQWEYK